MQNDSNLNLISGVVNAADPETLPAETSYSHPVTIENPGKADSRPPAAHTAEAKSVANPTDASGTEPKPRTRPNFLSEVRPDFWDRF